MKTIISICFLIALAVQAHAQGTAEWQRKAVAEFPELGVKDSFLNRAFVATYNILKRDAPNLLERENFGYTVAKSVSFVVNDAPNVRSLPPEQIAESIAAALIDNLVPKQPADLHADLRADFPKFRAKMIDEWNAIRKNPEGNSETQVRWAFKVSSITQNDKTFSIITFYSGSLGGRFGEQPVVVVTGVGTGLTGEPKKPVKRDDWIMVEGKFSHISSDGRLYIQSSNTVNLGYGFFDTSK
jgi:hypothetical protein